MRFHVWQVDCAGGWLRGSRIHRCQGPFSPERQLTRLGPVNSRQDSVATSGHPFANGDPRFRAADNAGEEDPRPSPDARDS